MCFAYKNMFFCQFGVHTYTDSYFAVYSDFVVEEDGLLSSIGTYHGNAGDAFSSYENTYWHNASLFWGADASGNLIPIDNSVSIFLKLLIT